uniref:Zeta toxin domain-containing protein n=1 Tax=viral metagenome TaxID=1070528 RepID=A0A6C0KS09_9ZZZZ
MSCDITPKIEVVDAFLEDRLKDASADKIAIVLVGGPGSGKSGAKLDTVQLLEKEQHEFINIDPDEILIKLFNNNTNCYDKVSVINNKSYEMAIKQNKNIIFDGTGRNFEWYSENVIKRLKDLGYVVNLVIVMNDVDVVLNRIAERARQTGRNVNTNYMKTVYTALNEAIPKYLSLDCLYSNNIFLYDNTNTLHLVYTSSCKGNLKLMKHIKGGKSRKAKKCKRSRRTRRK